MTEGEQQQQQQQQSLSKSWSIRRAHVPLYTGGPVEYSSFSDHGGGILWTPVRGNLAAVDCATGQTLATVRGTAVGQDEDNDDDQQLDADAIVAYAVHNSASSSVLLTVSQNSLMRQYAVLTTQQPQDSSSVDPNSNSSSSSTPTPTVQITLTKLWGKSGHTLPVTAMRFHASGIFGATGSTDGSCRIWDVRGGFVTHVFRGSAVAAVTCVEWFPAVQQLLVALGRDDGSIALHNLHASQQSNNNEPVTVLRDHVSAVTCVQWDTARHLLVSTGRDAVINL